MAAYFEVGTTGAANKRQKRTIDEKSRIFFVVDQATYLPDRKLWCEIDLNDLGSGARMLKKQPPSFFFGSAVGSYDSFLYSLGGWIIKDPEVGYPVQEAVTDTYFYNTTNPDEGWFAGPHMRSPRDRLCHQVIGSKLYVLGGAYMSIDDFESGPPHLVWGEYLDFSLPKWEWRPVLTTRHDDKGFPSGDLLDNEEYISSLPLFKGGFDPERHILCRCDTRTFRLLCFNVEDGSLCKVFECDLVFAFHPAMNVFVEGDYLVSPDSTRVLVLGTFSRSSSCPPWFVGDIQSAEKHFPPMPYEMLPWLFRNPGAFALVRIAPYKYASIWFPNPYEPYVSLSVFTICPPVSPPSGSVVDLESLLRWDLLCIDRVPATFEKRVDIPVCIPSLEEGHLEIKGVVAM